MGLQRATALLAILPAFAAAAIDGTVVNGTTGKPQAAVAIALVKPGQGGMRTLGTTTTDSDGRFAFAHDEPGGGPQLLQANFDGVNYNKLLTPNIPTSNVELDVFAVTKSAAVAKIAERMLLIEPSADHIAFNETVIVQNDSKTTFSNSSLGELRFYLPSAAQQLRVNAQGPQGMPLPREAQKTNEKDVYKVDFPIKPGETQFELTYTLAGGSPTTLSSQVVDVPGMQTSPLRLIAPPGVKLGGKDIQLVGTEPKTQASIYTVVSQGKFSVDVAGTGSLHGPEQTAGPEPGDEPELKQAPPRIYAHLPWLLVLLFGILGIGLTILYRSSPVRSSYGK
jgi:hypothetical protein